MKLVAHASSVQRPKRTMMSVDVVDLGAVEGGSLVAARVVGFDRGSLTTMDQTRRAPDCLCIVSSALKGMLRFKIWARGGAGGGEALS